MVQNPARTAWWGIRCDIIWLIEENLCGGGGYVSRKVVV
jgi:hypothetical protein